MPRRSRPLPRPSPRDRPYEVRVRNAQVQSDWETLVRTRHGPCTACWDHISTQPGVPVGSRYTWLKGTQKTVDVDGEVLDQWQWEIDRGARVKVGVGKGYVVVVSVSTGHPKENE